MGRFLRIERLIGSDALTALQNKKVTLVGLGAVGGYALEALARCGIRHLRLVDHDTVNITNINRQILALESTIGKPKVEVAYERVKEINPECEIELLQLFAHEESMNEILGDKPDIVIDAIDSLNPKATLLTSAYRKNIPIVSSMGAALRKDCTKIRTGDIFDTKNCRLAKILRKFLRNRNIGRGIQCVYSEEFVDYNYSNPENEPADPEEYEQGRKRSIIGSMSTITGIFGLTLAHLAIEKLLK